MKQTIQGFLGGTYNDFGFYETKEDAERGYMPELRIHEAIDEVFDGKEVKMTIEQVKSIDLTYMEKQLILYTKGHFTSEIGGINYNRDLKYFAAKIYGLWPEQVEKRTLFHMIVTLYQKLIDAGYIRFELEEYLSRLMKRAWLHYEMKDISFENILDQMLAEIQGTTVKGLNLGETDLSILDEDKYKRSDF